MNAKIYKYLIPLFDQIKSIWTPTFHPLLDGYKLKTHNRWVFYILQNVCRLISYMSGISSVKLKIGLALCYFHFSDRFNLARFDDILTESETVCFALDTPLCRWSLWCRVYVLELWYLCCYAHFSSTRWPSHSLLYSRLSCFLVCCLVSGNLKRKGAGKNKNHFFVINWVFLDVFFHLETFKSP